MVWVAISGKSLRLRWYHDAPSAILESPHCPPGRNMQLVQQAAHLPRKTKLKRQPTTPTCVGGAGSSGGISFLPRSRQPHFLLQKIQALQATTTTTTTNKDTLFVRPFFFRPHFQGIDYWKHTNFGLVFSSWLSCCSPLYPVVCCGGSLLLPPKNLTSSH